MATISAKLAGASTTLRGSALRPPPDDPLVAALCDEMRRRWSDGEAVGAEAFLERHPHLKDEPELALEIIYEEVCLRQERGATDGFGELARRFPQWENQLAVMSECHRLLEAPSLPPRFPQVGETVGDFHLLKLLGRGAAGRVFLASQPKLADRPVVVKFTAIHGQEHLNLARLQHTHIVPLYAVVDDAARNLRILCMPYFGGITLDQVLETLAGPSAAARAGAPESMAQILKAAGVEVTGAAETALRQFSYEQAICWIGMCLADALSYAHEGGLVHFDIKPANVLIASDGQPMLLDFHLAQPPLSAGGPLPNHLGGTAGYMPPEQTAALMALEDGKPLAAAVDHRADIHALGAILYLALGGELPYRAKTSRPLAKLNARVSPGFSDIVAKCLAEDARARYADAASLAEDLRRHIQDLPLRGVRNRSWRERYGKWRRRNPSTGRTLLLAAIVLASVAALGFGLLAQRRHLLSEATFALDSGGDIWRRGHFAEARALLANGRDNARSVFWPGDLHVRFDEELRQLEQAEAAAQRADARRRLHELAEHMRALVGTPLYPANRLNELRAQCDEFWAQRHTLKRRLDGDYTPEMANDLLDLALFAVELRVQTAPANETAVAAKQALAMLDEVERLFGPSLLLLEERNRRRSALGLAALPAAPNMAGPRTAWEHCLLSRTALQAGDPPGASTHLTQALVLEPQGFWPNFYFGLCSYRLGEFDRALAAFGVCIGSAPTAPAYYNRALCFAARRRPEDAVRDYDNALRLDPTLAAAALNRGMLHFERERFAKAEGDLRRALALGANPAAVHYDLAMVQLARNDKAAAMASLEKALEHDPQHAQTRALLRSLLK